MIETINQRQFDLWWDALRLALHFYDADQAEEAAINIVRYGRDLVAPAPAKETR